ncbi:MAG: hypothetical protein QXE31_01985 [Candidatus Woesearchaeota archaeon]
MEFLIYIILTLNFSITLMSLFICFYLLYHYFKDKHKNYTIHSLIKGIYILTFFLFIDTLYNTFLSLSQYGYINQKIYFLLSSFNLQLFPKIGLFFSTTYLVYFIMEKRIDEIKSKEDTLKELKELNQQLEKKLIETEKAQELLEKKTQELEKYNEIAKQREQKMLELMKKIEKIEKKVK